MLAAPKVYSRRFGWLRDRLFGRPLSAQPRPAYGGKKDLPEAAE
jgi:hypothetical protein